MADPRDEPRVGADRRQHAAHHRPAAAGVGDEVLVAQIGDPQRGAPGEGMAVGQRHQQPVPAHHLGAHTGMLHRRAQQRQVDLAGGQRGQLRRGQHLAADPDLHARQGLAQGADQQRQQRVGRRADTADGQQPLGALGDAPGLLAGVVDGVEDSHHALQVGRAGRGQLHAAGGADQQRHPELGLECADLLGQRGLGDVQSLRGAAEVQFLGDGAEVPQVTQFHTKTLNLSIVGI